MTTLYSFERLWPKIYISNWQKIKTAHVHMYFSIIYLFNFLF